MSLRSHTPFQLAAGCLLVLTLLVLLICLRPQRHFDTPHTQMSVAPEQLPPAVLDADRALGPVVPAWSRSPVRNPFTMPERALRQVDDRLPPPPPPRMTLPPIPVAPRFAEQQQ